jgi:hypothetical protein
MRGSREDPERPTGLIDGRGEDLILRVAFRRHVPDQLRPARPPEKRFPLDEATGQEADYAAL